MIIANLDSVEQDITESKKAKEKPWGTTHKTCFVSLYAGCWCVWNPIVFILDSENVWLRWAGIWYVPAFGYPVGDGWSSKFITLILSAALIMVS